MRGRHPFALPVGFIHIAGQVSAQNGRARVFQHFNERRIGRQEIESAKRLRKDPFMCCNTIVPGLPGQPTALIKSKVNFSIRIFVEGFPAECPYFNLYFQFFADLPGQRSLGRLSRLYLASGKLPLSRHVGALGTAADQNAPIPSDDSGYDIKTGS